MVELYIQNQLVDITKDIDIALTYEMTDLEKPEAVKTAYSKTVTLEGTDNNNRIFGEIYRFDKDILDGDNLINLNFNPNKRVDCYIVLNGNVLDSGYFKLDEIEYENNTIKYNLTLYLGVGGFFYNLMYDDEDEDKSLASLYYGINGMSKEEEDKNNLFEYNRDFVNTCWLTRCGLTSYSSDTTSMYNMFCPIPTHSGMYDNFKSEKVLVNTVVNGGKYFPESVTADSTVYSTCNGFSLVEAPRELEEWEVGDIRSHYQRLGVRLKNIYDAIKDSQNNGGYTVDDSELDEYSKRYIENGYIMLDRFDYETVNETNLSINPTMSKGSISSNTTAISSSISDTFDVSDWINPHISVSIVEQVETQNNAEANTAYTVFTGNSIRVGIRDYKDSMHASLQAYFLEYLDESNNSIGYSTIQLYGSIKDEGTEIGIIQDKAIERCVSMIKQVLGNNIKFNYQHLYNAKLLKNTDVTEGNNKYVGDIPIVIEDVLSKDCKKFRVCMFTVHSRFLYGYTVEESVTTYGYPLRKKELTIWEYSDFEGSKYIEDIHPLLKYGDYEDKYNVAGYIGNAEDEITQIYDGDVSENDSRHVLNKSQIFNDTDTPFDYLISLGKTFNWIFEKENERKRIKIYSKYNYYDKKVIDISEKVDRKNYTVQPSTLEYNKYLFNIPLPDTYATDLFKRKNNRIYSQFIYKPNYQFSSESNDILEDTKFTLAMPYTMHSVFMTNTDIPTPLLGNKFTVTLWTLENGLIDSSNDKEYIGALITSNTVTETYEQTPKLCCFDSDNKNVSNIKNCLVLYNGYEKLTDNDKIYWLSDYFPCIKGIADDDCYVLTNGEPVIRNYRASDMTYGTFQTRITYIPTFSVYGEDNISLLCNETQGYNDLYNLYFKNDYINEFSKDSRYLTIYYDLQEFPKNALKHFYYIDNSVYILNKITDYNPNNNDFTECEFIKIGNIDNFSKQIITA